MTDSLAELTAALGAEPPAAVRDLPPGTVTFLVEAIDAAKRAQRESMTEVLAQSLLAVPFPLRGVVKSVLLG